MTDDRLPLTDLLAKTSDANFLRSTADAMLQLSMEADVARQISVARYERTDERPSFHTGFRDCTLDTRLGSLALRILRNTSRKTLIAMIQETGTSGAPIRRGCDLVHGPLQFQLLRAVQGHRRAGDALPRSSAGG